MKAIGPIVETDKGKVEGYFQESVLVFKGIPYAAPPVGGLRWLPPIPHLPWRGVRQARKAGPVAPQNAREPVAFPVPGFETSEPQSEDCLYLNIWTPGLDGAPRPVMVWIHGGAFTIGSGSQPLYSGNILASRGNAVVVTINYRLGLLGFLNLNEITEGKIPATGNEGLLDQVAALRWVRDNIKVFGGDPNNVTVFGQSSGAMSIGCLMAMPDARGLFHRAILESGTGHMARPLDQGVAMSNQFLEAVGLKSHGIAAIRALSVKQLLAVQQALTLVAPGGVTPVAPLVDGKVLPEKAIDALSKGSAAAVPILIGHNLEESKIFDLSHPENRTVGEATMLRLLRVLVPAADVPRLVDTYRAARSRRGDPVTPPEILSAIRTDIMHRIPAIQVADAQCQNGQAAYFYIFTWKSPALGGILGACHALELGFVFDTREKDFCGAGPEAEELSMKMRDAWLAFSRSGNPGCESLGKWPSYCEKRKTMILRLDCSIEEAPYEEERRIWDSIHEVGQVA